MSTTAIPVATPGADLLAIAIDRHVGATSAILTGGLATSITSFAEPRTPDPDLAIRRLRYLVETLLGVAAGCVIGRVVSAVLRSFGSELDHRLEVELRKALRYMRSPREPSPVALTPARSQHLRDGAARPLVAELSAQLHPRLASASADHRSVLARLAAAIPAQRAAALATILAVLDEDPLLATVWSEHLTVSWRTFAIAIDPDSAELEAPASLAGTACHHTWRTWLRRVRGEPSPAAPRKGEYIMAVLG